MKLISLRKYDIVVVDSGSTDTYSHDLKEIISDGNDFEYMYAIHEIGDSVLDLKLYESLYFQSNRDSNTSKGIITRIR